MTKSLMAILVLVCAINSPAFADEDLAKANGPCRSKVEELQTTRKKLKDCLHAWIQSAKSDTNDPSDKCDDLTEAFVDKVKEIKACRAEHKGKEKK